MGCDIHLYVERQTRTGSWVRVPDSKGPKHPYYDPGGDERHKSFFDKPEWDVGRNYLLFGRLAGVRHHDIIPIVEPRGVPSDMSKSTAAHWKQGQGDWHTASYLTAKELLVAKDEPYMQRHCLSMKQYKHFLNGGKELLPEEDDNFIWGRPRNLNLISNAEMERFIALAAFWDGVDYYTDIVTPYKHEHERDTHLWNVILPAMLAIQPDPEKIRIVFWFDN